MTKLCPAKYKLKNSKSLQVGKKNNSKQLVKNRKTIAASCITKSCPMYVSDIGTLLLVIN